MKKKNEYIKSLEKQNKKKAARAKSIKAARRYTYGTKMRSHRAKRYSDNKSIVSTVIIVITGIALMVAEMLPALQPLRDNTAFIIITKAAISALVLFCAWLYAKRPSRLYERVVISVFAAVPWLYMFSGTSRTALLAETVVFYLLVISLIKTFFTDKCYSVVTEGVVLFLSVSLLSSCQDYAFIDDPRGFHFWQISLVVMAVATAVYIVLLKTGKARLTDSRTSEIVASVVLLAFGSFMFTVMTATNLNYALDISSPQEFYAEITDMDIDVKAKTPTEYTLTVNFRGEQMEINVSQSEYYAAKTGDNAVILLHNGAFGHSYFIYSHSDAR